MTDDLIELARDIFLYADGNGMTNERDHKLNQSEFRKFMRANPEKTDTAKDDLILLLGNLIDKNHNGIIEYNEFKEFYERVSRTYNPELNPNEIQMAYNKEHNIIPKTIIKKISESITNIDDSSEKSKVKPKNNKKLISEIESEMKEAARNLDFERAMELRDILFELKSE